MKSIIGYSGEDVNWFRRYTSHLELTKFSREHYNLTPIEAEIMLTRRCNLNCIMCNVPSMRKSGDMPTEKLEHVFEDLAKSGVRAFILSGGEPFLRRDLPELLERIRDLGIKCTIITNGTIFDERSLEMIINSGFNLMVSIDSPREKIHDRIRGSAGAFKSAMKTINYFNGYRKKSDSKSRLIAGIVVQKDNVQDLVSYDRFLHENNFDDYSLDLVSFSHKCMDKDSVIVLKDIIRRYLDGRLVYPHLDIIGDNQALFESIHQGIIEDKDMINGRPSESLYRKSNIPCFACADISFIDNSGNIYPCFQYERCGAKPVGNILKEGFQNIWFSSKYYTLRRERLRIDVNKTPICGACLLPFHFQKILNYIGGAKPV